jgi:hypothetical protein
MVGNPHPQIWMPFGPYRGMEIKLMTSPDQVQYLHWLRGSIYWPKLAQKYKNQVKLRLDGKL